MIPFSRVALLVSLGVALPQLALTGPASTIASRAEAHAHGPDNAPHAEGAARAGSQAGAHSGAEAEASPTPIPERIRLEHTPLPTTGGVRQMLPDRPADRLPQAPFAPAPGALDIQREPTNPPATETGRSAAATDALALLPPSRAPPAIS